MTNRYPSVIATSLLTDIFLLSASPKHARDDGNDRIEHLRRILNPDRNDMYCE